MSQQKLFEHLNATLGFSSDVIASAFKMIDRADFVLENLKAEAYFDYPLPIGFNATISQPTTVAFMINLLDPKVGEKILDVGAGSGWTTALFSKIVGKTGRIYGVEIVPELGRFAKKNLAKYEFLNVEILLAGKTVGLPEFAPFDKIMVSAAAKKLPQSLVEQLKVGGRMVIPIQNSIWQIDKVSEKEIQKSEFPGFVFVPLR